MGRSLAFFSKEYVGLLSSVCYIFYALGQLFNGFIGDKVHPRYMLAIGFCTSGIMTVLVPISNIRALHFICFARIGYKKPHLIAFSALKRGFYCRF